jgi:hypothetical protein
MNSFARTPAFRTIRLAGQGRWLSPSNDHVWGLNGAFAPMPSRTRRVYHPRQIGPFRRFVAHRWRRRDSAISEASQPPCDAAPRNASDHHLRGMRRAPPSRTACDGAGSHLDRVPQLRAPAPSGARRRGIADNGSCSPAFTDSVRVGGRRRLPRSLSDVAPSGAPSPGSSRRGRTEPLAVVLMTGPELR